MTSTHSIPASATRTNGLPGARLRDAVIVDECPLFRRGIAAVLAEMGVGMFAETDRGSNALRSLQTGAGGLLVVGSQLDASTLATVRRAKAMDDPVAVMALLAQGGDEDIRNLRDLGTEAIVTRHVEVGELRMALRHVMRGERFVATAPLAVLVGSGSVLDARANHSLTRRETEIIRCLAAGYSNNEIVDALVVSLPTVKTHLSHIYDKLGVRNRHDALGRAMQIGLLG